MYSNKDIFLRELITNASDAIDRRKVIDKSEQSQGRLEQSQGRLEQSQGRSIKQSQGRSIKQSQGRSIKQSQENISNFVINIEYSVNNNSITITDNGIGMNAIDINEYIGCVGNSKADNSIGKFGIGFYSVFLVSNKIHIITKKRDHQSILVKIDKDNLNYSINNIDDDINIGTTIILYDIVDDYELSYDNISDNISKYCAYVKYPIVIDNHQINFIPFWNRNDSYNIKKDTYEDLYRNIIKNDKETFYYYKHFTVEYGDISFVAILFIPNKEYVLSSKGSNIKLFYKNIYISDDETSILCPNYFNFIHGIVDCKSLNIVSNREFNINTNEKTVSKIQRILTRKIVEMIEELYNKYVNDNDNTYYSIYKLYRKNIKLAASTNSVYRDRLMKTLLFHTNKNIDKMISLDLYNVYNNQILYITGTNLQSLIDSPYIENLDKDNIEIVFMVDIIDEFLMNQVTKYEKEIYFINITRDVINYISPIDKNDNNTNLVIDNLTKYFKKMKYNKIIEITVSNLFNLYPSIIKNKIGITPQMESIMRNQQIHNIENINLIEDKNIEINMNHKIIKKYIDSDYDENYAEIIYQFSFISSDYPIENKKLLLESLSNVL
jgi:HSP90 family molecular chaperone